MVRLKRSELFQAISERFKIPINELYGIEGMLLDKKRKRVREITDEFDRFIKGNSRSDK